MGDTLACSDAGSASCACSDAGSASCAGADSASDAASAYDAGLENGTGAMLTDSLTTETAERKRKMQDIKLEQQKNEKQSRNI